MVVLSLKVLAIVAPFVAISIPPVIQTLQVMVQAERSTSLRTGVFDDRLEGKWTSLMHDAAAVIVAGDSRAERHVIPAMVEARTGWRTVNVASTAQDLITLSNAVTRHGLPTAARVLVIGTSVFQVNDGAIAGGYISTATLLNMTSWERARIYADRLGSPWSPLAFRFVEEPPAVIPPAQLAAQGFAAVDGQLSLPLPKVLLDRHPWYRNVTLRGARWRIFQGALDRLAATGLRIYLMLPPTSPAWRAYTAGTFVDTAELEFASMLNDLVPKYSNLRVFDFYTEGDARLTDALFSDIQHLNRAGAELFTGMLVDHISLDLRLQPVSR